MLLKPTTLQRCLIFYGYFNFTESSVDTVSPWIKGILLSPRDVITSRPKGFLISNLGWHRCRQTLHGGVWSLIELPHSLHLPELSAILSLNKSKVYIKENILRNNIKNLRGLSPRVNYTDRENTACRRSLCQLVRIESATWSAWLIYTAVFFRFLDPGAATFSFKKLLNCTHEAERASFQTHYFSENLVEPEIEPGPLDL
jgi:hypothetical protein